MISRRDHDPETWLEDRDEARARDDELDTRGTQAERALENLVYGDDYNDWHGQRTERTHAAIMAAERDSSRALGQVRA